MAAFVSMMKVVKFLAVARGFVLLGVGRDAMIRAWGVYLFLNM